MLYFHLDIKNATLSLSNTPELKLHYLQVLERPKQAVKYAEFDLEPFLIVHPETKASFYLYVSDTYRNTSDNSKRIKPPTPNATTVSLHKSNLQKAIRLGNKTAALTSLEWLYQSDPIQLLRRLPIILLEDSAIHPYFSLLVLYSMIYTDIDSKYDGIILQQLKQVVLDAIANPIHQRTIVYEGTPETIPVDFLQKPLELLECQNGYDLLFMFIRYCYGGLEGDMIMLQRFILYGLKTPLTYCTVLDVDKEKEESSLLPSAVDFHVFPNLLEDCRKQLARKQIIVDCDTIKSVIWNCRSRTNFRENYSPSYPIWWDDLLVYLDKESKFYWDIYCNSKANSKKLVKEKKQSNNTIFNYFKST